MTHECLAAVFMHVGDPCMEAGVPGLTVVGRSMSARLPALAVSFLCLPSARSQQALIRPLLNTKHSYEHAWM